MKKSTYSIIPTI